MQRKSPGLLLRDLVEGTAEDAQAAAHVVGVIKPDILLLTSVDWDHGLAAAGELARLFKEQGADYPHLFALRPNTGLASGHDLDGDGRLGGPRDAQGYGWFSGQGGMLLMSRYPIDAASVRDFSAILWKDVPGAIVPMVDKVSFPSAEALSVQRLSHAGHWVVPIALPGGAQLDLLAFAAGTPVFDGPEDRNGRRNHDELRLWQLYLDGVLGPVSGAPVVLLGNANLDPNDGDGRREILTTLLDHPDLQDPQPRSAGAEYAAYDQGGANARHTGDPALDTVDWGDDGPGNLRVSYVLPDASLSVAASGIFWPLPDDPLFGVAEAAGRHRLVWVDIEIPTR